MGQGYRIKWKVFPKGIHKCNMKAGYNLPIKCYDQG
jgi:hypothetical protein